MSRLRRWATYAALAFVVFYLFSRPVQAAAAVNGVLDGIFAGADQLAVFFTKVAT